jgi:hypothetical protein
MGKLLLCENRLFIAIYHEQLQNSELRTKNLELSKGVRDASVKGVLRCELVCKMT